MSETAEQVVEPVQADGEDEELEVEDEKPEVKPEANFDSHGGDPRSLDLARSLLISKLPSAFVSDSIEVFSECVSEILNDEYAVSKDAIEKIVRISKLDAAAEDKDNALRALVLFKSRVHKHRVFAQKKVQTNSSIGIDTIDELAADMTELEELDVTDEIGDDEEENGHHDDDSHQVDEPKDEDKTEEVKEERKKYDNEDKDAPFEVSWDGAPEFQWKLCTLPTDARKLIIENVLWSDLRNVFIYRVLMKAESVDVSFPMRHNIEGSKQMYGRLVLMFHHGGQIMMEAMAHLIYVRCAHGRRLKVFLPQVPMAMKMKEEFEGKLGRVIKPTPRMFQIVVKVLPTTENPFTIESAKQWFPHQADKITEYETVEDEMNQKCGIVTFSDVDAVMDAHSSLSFVTVKGDGTDEFKCHVFLKGVEAHFGSLITRIDRKKSARQSTGGNTRGVKRTGPSLPVSNYAKKFRGGASSIARGGYGSPSPRGSFISRGSSSSFNTPPYRGRGAPRGSFRSPGGHGMYNDHNASSSYRRDGDLVEESLRLQRREYELKDQLYRNQQMLDNKYGGRPYDSFDRGGSRDYYGGSSSGGYRGSSGGYGCRGSRY